MKILLVASDNNRYSGAFKSMTRLAKHLVDDFYNDVLVILPYAGNGADLLENENINYLYCSSYDWVTCFKKDNPQKWKKKKIQYKLNKYCVKHVKKVIKDYNPDIIHINTSWCYLFGLIGIKLNILVVWHIREFLNEDQDMHFINRKFSINTLKKANKVICISNAIYKKYEKIGLNNLTLIYNGIDEKIYNSIKKKISNVMNFSVIGTIGKSKGQIQIVEWFIKLVKERILIKDKFVLKLIGRCGEQNRQILDELILSNKLDGSIFITGPIDDPCDIYNNSSIIIVNSKSEAFGRTTVEGMMNQCLIIGANTGGTPELIEDKKTGLLFEYNNYDSFKETIKYVLSNQSECNLIINDGYNKAIKFFNSYKNAYEIYEVYKKMLNH